MPARPPKPCGQPGCPKLVTKERWCPDHAHMARQWDSPKLARARQAKRQYATWDARWRRIRADVLSHEPLCRICRAEGLVTAATVVNHIDEDATNNDPSNLQPLCQSCHSRKTAQERAGKASVP